MQAPGGPGAPPSWGPGRKQGFGTSASRDSRVWFTLADGALSEVFYPSVDHPLLHQMRFIAAAAGTPPIDAQADGAHTVRWLEPGIPSFVAETRHAEFALRTEYVTEPELDALLVSGTFAPELPDLALYVLLSPHLVPGSPGNDARVLGDRDPPVLVARQGAHWVALMGPFAQASVGFLNSSDVFVDLYDNDGEMQWLQDQATGGNVALGARLGIRTGTFLLSIGFGSTAEQAEEVAREARARGFADTQKRFVDGWRRRLDVPRPYSMVSGDRGDLARASLAVLLSLEDKGTPGAFVAAPCAPWGETCGDGNHVYHLVWPRDLYQVASALLHAGDPLSARRAFAYLRSIQRADGSWPQNCTVDGVPHWNTPELDETAYPILLAWELKSAGALDVDPWPVVRQAALYLLQNGPGTALDRWEDAGGISPSTVAAGCAALLAAAELAQDSADADCAGHLRAVADYWSDRLQHWCFARPAGFFARLAEDPDEGVGPDAAIAVEFLELVRRGLRHPEDPAVLSSLKAVDEHLKTQTPKGAAWRRYLGDAYGERADGSAWRGAGIGRPWPILTGERAQYELAAGRPAVEAVAAFEAFAGPELLLPEQVWDGEPILAGGLEPGGATGSARPLGWAHAEYVKLLSSIAAGAVIDVVAPARRWFLESGPRQPDLVWHHNHRIHAFPPGRQVTVQLPAAADVVWTGDAWETSSAIRTRGVGLGLHTARLPTHIMRPGAVMEWTAHYADNWEGANYQLTCVEPDD
ncbi:MAG TPA: glycoside hydrolase family 15 protein [Candidatus Dormibacteraeota bacterium]